MEQGNGYLTSAEVAELLRVSTYTVRAWARNGVLPASKLGSDWRFKWADIEVAVLQQQPRQ